MFDKINSSAGREATQDATPDRISTQDLGFVLIQYGMPASDARHVMRKYDATRDGTLSFEEFKAAFKPLITFQISELKGRVAERRRNQERIKLERLASRKNVMQAGNDLGHNINAVVDASMDAVADVVGELSKQVGSRIIGHAADEDAATEAIIPGSTPNEHTIGV